MVTEVGEAVAAGGASTAEEIKPYKLHVSSRYLDLTSQKLEVTRLPHELDEPKSQDWWQPKPQVEPLIDFWLDQYSWREQEDQLNAQLPQYRTGFTIPSSEAPIRIHFIHIRSTHQHAIPLLLIPPFPSTNLSLGHLVKLFTDPEDVEKTQPFHLVIPSLPGLGFSDALPNNVPVISNTADIMNLLMKRLSYPYYLITNASPGAASPAEIDYKLANHLAKHYTDSCLGTHLISPPLDQPKLQVAPIEWAKWSIASFLRAPILGYRSEDFSALERSGYVRPFKKPSTPAQFGLNRLGLTEPNTLAYALCDSPTGLLVFVLKSLRLLGPQKQFAPTELLNFTTLAWLPGPESAMRFWAYCAHHPEVDHTKPALKPKVGITVFLGDEAESRQASDNNDGNVDEADVSPQEEAMNTYSCPSWARARYNVAHTNRVVGKPGLLAWERPEIIASGIRGLAAAILGLDDRLRPSPESEVVPLQQVVVGDGTAVDNEEMTPAPAKPSPALLAPPKIDDRGHPHRQLSDDTAVASDENLAAKTPSPIPMSPVHLTPSPGIKKEPVLGSDNRRSGDGKKNEST
ncbi:alpha/beta-hydrolase [Xylariaceae sp. FL0016]|nr:alpha/beta-hydrolase [Xylariaceae sp. FL0016]